MNKHIYPPKQRSRIYTVIQIAIYAVVFLAAFAIALGIMNYVYGYGYEIPLSYYQTINAPLNATETTTTTSSSGFDNAIDSYVKLIKHEICPTLNDTAEIKECNAI